MLITENTLKVNGFVKTRESKYATEYKNSGITLYIVNNETNLNLVISPDDMDDRFDRFEHNIYHSLALINFPKRINNGKTPIHYGYKFNFKNEISAKEFIEVLLSK